MVESTCQEQEIGVRKLMVIVDVLLMGEQLQLYIYCRHQRNRKNFNQCPSHVYVFINKVTLNIKY